MGFRHMHQDAPAPSFGVALAAEAAPLCRFAVGSEPHGIIGLLRAGRAAVARQLERIKIVEVGRAALTGSFFARDPLWMSRGNIDRVPRPLARLLQLRHQCPQAPLL